MSVAEYVERVAPYMSVRQVLMRDFPIAVPELVDAQAKEWVFHEELLGEELRDMLDGDAEERGGQLRYPFVSLFYDGMVAVDGLIEGRRQVPSLNPNFTFDIMEQQIQPEHHRTRVTLYYSLEDDENMTKGQKYAQALAVGHRLRNYCRPHGAADGVVDPVTGKFSGFWMVQFNPATGLLVDDQENPPAGSQQLFGLVTNVTNMANGTTVLDEKNNEGRLEFFVDVGFPAVYETRVPGMANVGINADPGSDTRPTEPIAPQPSGITAEWMKLLITVKFPGDL